MEKSQHFVLFYRLKVGSKMEEQKKVSIPFCFTGVNACMHNLCIDILMLGLVLGRFFKGDGVDFWAGQFKNV